MVYQSLIRTSCGLTRSCRLRSLIRPATLLHAAVLLAIAAVVSAAPGPLAARESYRDSISALLSHAGQPNPPSQLHPLSQQRARRGSTVLAQDAATPSTKPGQARAKARDPRAGDKTYEQAQRLMRAINAILKDTAQNRSDARKLPSRKDFLVTPIWTETKEDRQQKIRDLLDAALGIVTDAPIVNIQKRIEKLRNNIRELDNRIVELREKRLVAPKDGMLPGIITDTKNSLQENIDDAKSRIAENKKEIETAKIQVHAAMTKAGVELTPDQVDLLMESVLSGDLIRLVAAFKAARIIDAQLGKLVSASADNLSASRKYFAMHAALFAMLKHAQDMLIGKIDKQYLPRLRAIERDIKTARARTNRLLRARNNRPDQRRALRANRESQKLAQEAARGYRHYLLQQREQIARARRRASHDLNIADNTYETVEASFQLRNLMRDSTTSFEALQKLETPTFDQIFRNEQLRKEFENLTKKLEVPTS